MRKPKLWLALMLVVLMVSSGTAWSRYVEQAERQGVEVSVSLLPLGQWGFGVNRVQVPAARPLPDGSAEIPRDYTRRVGLISVRERRWVPLHHGS